MATAELKAREQRPARRFTVDEIYRMADAGLFDGQRLELIDGEILEMLPQNNRHATALLCAMEALGKAFANAPGVGFHIRPQLPLKLSKVDQPEPDIAVVRGAFRRRKEHPRSAALIVEISEATYLYDTRRKASLYARAGIPDYWVVDLKRNRLEVYRVAIEDPLQPFGHRYSTGQKLSRGKSISPLALPGVEVAVADLLP